jgi:hydroxyethylthiazole kinase-like uncharacterized protein yjeF
MASTTFPLRLGLPMPKRGWPLFDAAGSRALEAAAAAGTPAHTLMQRAGIAVARLALAIAPGAGHIAVLAGPGNNGGDGFEAALHLHRAGKSVTVHALGEASGRPADASASLQRAREAGVRIVEGGTPATADLLIDALLGLGASRPPAGALRDTILAINASAAPCLAVDVPSGLDADHGCGLGNAVVRATHTLALLTLKPGLLTAQGRDHVGTLWLDPIGSEPCWPQVPPRAWLTGASDVRALAQERPHAGHKGHFGDVIVIGGAPGMAGAATLAARAALAGGAGRVYLAPLDASLPGHDAAAPELMWRPGVWRDHPQALDDATVVCGCGGGTAVQEVLPVVLSRSARLVLDADGLNAVAADPALRALLVRRGAVGRPTVLTPHPLEAARLLGRPDAAKVQADRLAAAEALAAEAQAVVALKGSGTIVVGAGRTCTINPTGDARLASAGTGDVLAGWLGGWWSATRCDAFDAARAAVWAHGAALTQAPGPQPLRASDLIERLAAR